MKIQYRILPTVLAALEYHLIMTIQTNSNQGPHSPPSSKRKEIRRCVSMCTSEMTSPDSSNYAQDIQSTSHDDNQSPDDDIQLSSSNEISRKRARNEIDSQSNEQNQKHQPIDSNASSQDSQDLDPSCRLDPNEEASASKETKTKSNFKINVNAPEVQETMTSYCIHSSVHAYSIFTSEECN